MSSNAVPKKDVLKKSQNEPATVTDVKKFAKVQEFPGDPEKLVLRVDKNDGEMRPRNMNLNIPLEPNHAESAVREATLNKELAGLCMNCLHSEDCVHAGDIGGIWHCENYE